MTIHTACLPAQDQGRIGSNGPTRLTYWRHFPVLNHITHKDPTKRWSAQESVDTTRTYQIPPIATG